MKEDFYTYKSGVYQYTNLALRDPPAARKSAFHSVRIVGWVRKRCSWAGKGCPQGLCMYRCIYDGCRFFTITDLVICRQLNFECVDSCKCLLIEGRIDWPTDWFVDLYVCVCIYILQLGCRKNSSARYHQILGECREMLQVKLVLCKFCFLVTGYT